MSNHTVRRFVFTFNNYTESDIDIVKLFITANCKYGIFGKEIAPNTGTRHLQGYCNLSKPMRFSTIKKCIGNSIHIEKAVGSDHHNQTYCSKTGDIFEAGAPVKRGERTDLQSLLADIQNGDTSKRVLAEKHPSVYIRYFRGIDEYLKLLHPIPVRDFKTEVYYYWGRPGTGKSRTALEEARQIDKDSIYYKPRGLWWCRYQQNTCVVIDDFYGWIKYDELLKICDRYPYRVQTKGSSEEFTSKHIWITSNVPIENLYKFEGYDSEALRRRITTVKHFL
nr:replication-associated protein [Army ant associated cyclovirus 2]